MRRYERIVIGNRRFLKPVASFGQIFTYIPPSPVEHFYTNIYALYNFVADSSLFTERNFVANFLLQKCTFRMKLSHTFSLSHFRAFALSHFITSPDMHIIKLFR